MGQGFEYFAIFAEMRTGSNFLEESLNDYPGIKCYGEVFNPHFIGHANQTRLLGLSLQEREADPLNLLARMKRQTDGLPGFRFFHDHDPRILSNCLADRACAKIILTRNPVDSYVSHQIARETGQWRIGDAKGLKTARIRFDPAEFQHHLASRQHFQLHLLRALQSSGQTGFYLDYEDIGELDVLNGLARFLGASDRKSAPSRKTKKQNPQSLQDKVVNFPEMNEALLSVDHFDLSRTPNFEPRRGPAVPNFIAAARAPVLFIPIRGGPSDSLINWLADLDNVSPSDLTTGFNQKTLRQWKRQTRSHQSFSVVRHPVARLYAAFVKHILLPGPERYDAIRDTLQNAYMLTLPDEGSDAAAFRASFVSFASFVRANLAGQTGVRVDGAWASQSEVLKGVCQFMIPDHVFREETLQADLAYLADRLSMSPPIYQAEEHEGPFRLSSIYDETVEAAVRAAYQKDYMQFGFETYASAKRPDLSGPLSG